ncbi:MAG: hypothetical protein K2H76_03670, partial [Muribaculaceae bacterium]|nr:hypothetical protein [Muribaculaceae bacterium]
VDISLRTNEGGGKPIELNVREYPFRLRWNKEENILILKDPDGKKRPFRHSLLVFRLKHPSVSPVTISSDEDGILRMPTDLIAENDLLIAGNVPGRVLPVLFNKSDNEHTPSEIEGILEHELLVNPIGSEIWKESLEWFNQAARYGIPFSSLHQLKAISLHQETLLAFLFQCLLLYGADRKEDLYDRLIQFSRDLSFKWFWLLPILRKGIFKILEGMMDFNNETFVRMLVPPAISTLPIEYLEPIALNLIAGKMNELDYFLTELIKKSFKDTHRPVNDEMYEVGCGWIKNNGQYADRKLESRYEWFPDFSSYIGTNIEELNQYAESNVHSENWLLSRVSAFVKHMMDEQTDLFSFSMDARRSMCLCYEVAPNNFIRGAHNKMIDTKRK